MPLVRRHSGTRYNPLDFTWGFEFEVGDVRRDIEIPKSLGSWEYAETDVVNQREPYRYVAADPLGIDPPVGGEINTYPTRSLYTQIQKIGSLIELFENKRCRPTVSNCVMEAHVHVGVPGLTEDIDALKRLTNYIVKNQNTVINRCVAYEEHQLMKETKTARTYLKWDMGRPMPVWMAHNIQRYADNFGDFIRLQCCGKDAKSMGRPLRYTINTYCLKHTNTVEFRCFRATLDLKLLTSCFEFVRDFMVSALNGGPTAEQIIIKNNYKFPPFVYNHKVYLGWEKTKWSKERGKKQRRYIQI